MLSHDEMAVLGDPGKPIKVLVVGADPLARGGLVLLLEREPEVVVLGQTAPGADLAAALEGDEPDAVVWDLGRGPGAADTGRIRDLERYRLPAVVLVADEDAAAEAYGAGARALLFRDAEPARIVAALQAVAEGLVTLDDALATALLRPPAALQEAPQEALTPRELEVLQLLAMGLGNKQIGDRLAISEHTAKFHVNAILAKLGARTRTEGVVRAARLGLVIL